MDSTDDFGKERQKIYDSVPKLEINDLPEDQKPGCFGAIGKGIFQCRRDCRNGKGCRWEPRCRQSQVDY